ncbi:DUF2188 domain-containing protein [Rudaea cellulosilytica]|uniref:DUF2188 domain-containing protein n=1 Tax=Rudaea cellulosilytica TaxID=540746 RepID=UPI000A02593A|nr:DUF2188 domain-containing protein [Rudaea cellulosilytica]
MNKKYFVEKRGAGEYAVLKPNAKRASALAATQAEAIRLAKQFGSEHPDIERVRHTSVGKPDKWRGQ